MLPQNYVKLEGKAAQQMVKLMEAARGARRHARRSGRTPTSKRRRSRPRWREDLRDRSRLRAHGVRLRRDATAAVTVSSSAARLSAPATRDVPRKLHAHPRRARRAARASTGPTASPSRTSSTRSNVRSALKLGHARGVALLAASEAGRAGRRVRAGRNQARGRRLRPRREAAGAADDQAAARPRRRPVAARRRRRARGRDLPRAQRRPGAVAERARRRTGAPRGAARSWRDYRPAGATTDRDRPPQRHAAREDTRTA